MKNSLKIAICLLLYMPCILFSCKENMVTSELLLQAQRIADDNPSEALILLDSIHNPEALDKNIYMQYIVTRIQAKFKSGQDISNDTIIFQAQKYFDSRNDPHNSALANFYAGNVYYKRNNPDKALDSYLNAEVYARMSKDNILTGRSQYNIGYQYYTQDVMDSAIVHYKLALDYFERELNTDKLKMQLLYSLGSAYFVNRDIDSSYFTYSRGLELATKLDNKKFITIFTNHIGVALGEKGEYKEASNKLHTSLSNVTTTIDTLRIYLNLSILYNRTEQADSAKYYGGLISTRLNDITDKYVLSSVYGTLSETNKMQGYYAEALRYVDLQKETISIILDEEKSLELMNADKNFSLIQKDKQDAIFKGQVYFWLTITCGIIISLVILALLLFRLNKKDKREIALQVKKYDDLEYRLAMMSRETEKHKAEIISMLDDTHNDKKE